MSLRHAFSVSAEPPRCVPNSISAHSRGHQIHRYASCGSHSQKTFPKLKLFSCATTTSPLGFQSQCNASHNTLSGPVVGN
jgi:hypothetical protein